MDDVTRRKAITLAATTGVVAGGIIAVGSSKAEAQQEKVKQDYQPYPKGAGGIRPGERVFEGESADDKLQAALEAALQKLDTALPEGNVSDASASWRLLDVAGQRGGNHRTPGDQGANRRHPATPVAQCVTRAGSGGSRQT